MVFVKQVLDLSAHRWKGVPSSDTLLFHANQPPQNDTHKFYKEVQKYWSEAGIINHTIQEQLIWNNSYIAIAKQRFY